MKIDRIAIRQGIDYYRSFGLIAFVRRFVHLYRYGPELPSFVPAPRSEETRTGGAPLSAVQLLARRFQSLRPLGIYRSPVDPPRLNLVTDSINKGSLFGGVATAILLAALLAERRGMRLRIVTRTEKPNTANVRHVLDCNGIEFSGIVEFAHAPVGSESPELDVGANDHFLTTSWWTTASVLGSVPVERVIYLLQEDERMFYSLGDDFLRAGEIMRHAGLRIVINSRMLFEHLVAEGFTNLVRKGASFEPAFDPRTFHPVPRIEGGKRRFFFYGRPNNLRNLFYRGIEAIDAAVRRGVLDLAEWDIHMAGKDLPAITFGDGYRPIVSDNLSWQEYGELVRGMDLGLCLMYTPHPSYPPLDLAACGAAVVTNRFGPKHDLDRYCRNILCVEPDLESLVEGLTRGVRLAADAATRQRHLDVSGIQRDWRAALTPVVDQLA